MQRQQTAGYRFELVDHTVQGYLALLFRWVAECQAAHFRGRQVHALDGYFVHLAAKGIHPAIVSEVTWTDAGSEPATCSMVRTS